MHEFAIKFWTSSWYLAAEKQFVCFCLNNPCDILHIKMMAFYEVLKRCMFIICCICLFLFLFVVIVRACGDGFKESTDKNRYLSFSNCTLMTRLICCFQSSPVVHLICRRQRVSAFLFFVIWNSVKFLFPNATISDRFLFLFDFGIL